MIGLGICDSQDAGAVLIDTKTGRIAAVNEERISRVKLQGGFPYSAVKEAMRMVKKNTEEIDLVAVASNMTPSFFLRFLEKVHVKLRRKNTQFSLLLSFYIIYQVIAKTTGLIELIESKISCFIIKAKLKRLGIRSRVCMVEHHRAHAYGAYITSGFEKALIFTIDGLGDGVSFTVNIGDNGFVKRIFEQKAINDITLYYSRLTEFLGFTAIQDEGKVMGLAAYSRDYSALEQAKKLLCSKQGRFGTKNIFFPISKDKKVFEELKTKKDEDIAASFQLHAENIISDIVRYWVQKTGVSKVALSGGFFANIKVNQKIAQMEEISEVYTYPHMGDGGLALGAVCDVCRKDLFKLENVFFGPCYSNEQIKDTLNKRGIDYEEIDDIESKIAVLLSKGKIVARFSGAMEYGPRALGNRSILASAQDEDVINILNAKLCRNDFMPFAPSILHECKDKCCLGTEKAVYSASFMNISFDSTDYFKKNCPAAVHRDGTTRPQFVSKTANAGFHKIIEQYYNITGIPALLNTSFNLHGEPIVCSPENALDTFFKSRIDYLAINNFLVKGEKNEKG